MGTDMEPVPVTGLAANFSPIPRIAPPPLGNEIAGGATPACLSELDCACSCLARSSCTDSSRDGVAPAGLPVQERVLAICFNFIDWLMADPAAISSRVVRVSTRYWQFGRKHVADFSPIRAN